MIIAEIGSNHEGTELSCLKCIAKSKLAGADAVKFQYFSEHDLYGPGHSKAPTKASIKKEWLPALKERADNLGIELMCSAFSVDGYIDIDPYVNTHKVASPENNHIQVLYYLKTVKKPVILSCGAANREDIKRAVKILDPVAPTLLYCVSAYPAAEVRLEKIQALKALFPRLEVGFSDHSLDYTCAPVEAMRHYKAKVLEKHFNPLGLLHTPDAGVALKEGQFKEMCQRIKSDLKFDYGIEEQEKQAILSYNRRIVATRRIHQGDKFDISAIGIYRVKENDIKGLSPHMLESLMDKTAPKDFEIGDPIHL